MGCVTRRAETDGSGRKREGTGGVRGRGPRVLLLFAPCLTFRDGTRAAVESVRRSRRGVSCEAHPDPFREEPAPRGHADGVHPPGPDRDQHGQPALRRLGPQDAVRAGHRGRLERHPHRPVRPARGRDQRAVRRLRRPPGQRLPPRLPGVPGPAVDPGGAADRGRLRRGRPDRGRLRHGAAETDGGVGETFRLRRPRTVRLDARPGRLGRRSHALPDQPAARADGRRQRPDRQARPGDRGTARPAGRRRGTGGRDRPAARRGAEGTGGRPQAARGPGTPRRRHREARHGPDRPAVRRRARRIARGGGKN